MRLIIPAALFFLPLIEGCGLIFGNQRVDNKSHDYTVVRLDRDKSAEWRVLTPDNSPKRATRAGSAPDSAPAANPDDQGDLAFEHKETGAIISLDSVCGETRESSLEELSKYLLLGLNTRGEVVSHDTSVDGVKALESEVEAAMIERRPSGEDQEYPVKVRTVVLRKNSCTYDLMYIARASVFERLTSTFDRFTKGFHVQ